MEVMAEMERLAARNKTDVLSFLGAGFYDHYIPAAVDALSMRGEFYTAYTPYQPEASQGTLQAIFEYQTAICRLFDMECANASSYDGGSSIFEAMMMAVRKTRRERLVICETVNPIYRIMLDSYTSNLDLDLVTVPHANGEADLEALRAAVDEKTAGVVVQNPNFFGCVGDYSGLFEHVRDKGALSIISVYPVMQAVLKTPGEMGADIAVAEGQSLGLPLSFGGPYLGVMTCAKKLVRQLPGRIAGRTEDTEGRTGYVLTLQAREQHIRRQKATSNICSNQALCALRALIHLSLLGPDGLSEVARTCMGNARYAAERLTAIQGVELLGGAPFAGEFAIRLPVSAWSVVDAMAERGIVPGFPLGRYYKGMDDCLLVACTEKHSRENIGILAEIMGGLL
jgi:glycine dehydrogenase subunit 1